MPKFTRGQRNNNPLNIRFNVDNHWKREVRPSEDPDFCQFLDMSHGFRAAMIVLRSYITKYHLTSVSKIIQRFAPASENDTRSYVSYVFNSLVKLGFDPNNIDCPSDAFFNMVRLMAIFESRVRWTVEDIRSLYYELC